MVFCSANEPIIRDQTIRIQKSQNVTLGFSCSVVSQARDIGGTVLQNRSAAIGSNLPGSVCGAVVHNDDFILFFRIVQIMYGIKAKRKIFLFVVGRDND